MAVYDVHRGLYTADELLEGFAPDDPMGFVLTYDFRAFRQFVIDGAAMPKRPEVRQRQAAHDAHISHALREYLETGPKLAGVMGGHKVRRDTEPYELVARLGRFLTRRGFVVVTGGGPGAMEAAHLGAACARADDGLLDRALAAIREVPALPDLRDVLNAEGDIVPGREQALRDAHAWLTAALTARTLLPADVPPSLAIPTWLYGQEPTMPFATHYAKYFHNSTREETLVTEARAGIVYARGGGGTVREIFQDVEQNYYAPNAAAFTPMVFFDPEGYWERHATFDQGGQAVVTGIKLDDMLPPLIRFARAKQGDADACLAKVIFTIDLDTIVRVLDEHAAVAQEHMHLMLAGSVPGLPAAALNR